MKLLAALACPLLCTAAAAATVATVIPGAWVLATPGGSQSYADQTSCVAAASALPVGMYSCTQNVSVAVMLKATGSVQFAPWLGPADSNPAPTSPILGFHIWKAQAAPDGSCPVSGALALNWVVAASPPDPSSGATVGGLVNGVRWCFKITTYSKDGDSPDSFIVSRDIP